MNSEWKIMFLYTTPLVPTLILQKRECRHKDVASQWSSARDQIHLGWETTFHFGGSHPIWRLSLSQPALWFPELDIAISFNLVINFYNFKLSLSCPNEGNWCYYRVTHLVANLGWVDLDVGRGPYCSYLLPKQARGTPQIKVNTTQVLHQMCHPVVTSVSLIWER